MPDFNVRSDAINVEQIMEQIRARIQEKRGADYTEQQIQDLANVKLEKFLDPKGVRSDLLAQFRRAQPPYSPPELPNFAFEEDTLFESHRGPLRAIRKLLRPILKLFFNPNPLIQALNIQARLNTMAAEREAKREAARHTMDQLHYEVLHNLVVETTRLGIEVKNVKMRVESLASRLEFNERRARALESVVVYKPSTEERAEPPAREVRVSEPMPPREMREVRDAGTQPSHGSPAGPPAPSQPGAPEGPGQRSRRRRRRRGRRGGGGSAAAMMGGQGTHQPQGAPNAPGMEHHASAPDDAAHDGGGDDHEPDAPGGDGHAPDGDSFEPEQ